MLRGVAQFAYSLVYKEGAIEISAGMERRTAVPSL
jgi:hypothetical protein